jgi:hypothetical protein
MDNFTIIDSRLPLAMQVETSAYHDESRDYEVTLEVEGAPHTRITATVNKPDHEKPALLGADTDDSELLPQHLRNRLLLLVFRLLYSEMVDAGGQGIEWHMNDGSRWIRRQFGFVDGQRIISALVPHVPDVEPFQSWNCIRID